MFNLLNINAGPLKQTILKKQLLVISTANNGGMPFTYNGPKLNGNYETVKITIDTIEDIKNRLYNSIELLETYQTSKQALKGHIKWIKKFKAKILEK